MKKSFGGFALFLIVLSIVMTAICAWQAHSLPDVIEYAVMAEREVSVETDTPESDENAPKPKPATQLKLTLDKLEDGLISLSKVTPTWAVWGYAQGVTIAEKDQPANTASVPLRAIGQGYRSVYPMLELSGRPFLDDELKYGDPVALLDEQLALKLFQTDAPFERELTIADKNYRIVGVLRHARTAGDPAEYSVYVPLNALTLSGGQQLDQLVLAAVPQPGSGSLQAVEEAARQWMPGGTLTDSRKEKQRALLMARWVSGALLIIALTWLYSALVRLGMKWVNALKAGLQRKYMVKLIPHAALRALAWLLGLGALLFLSYHLFNYMVSPILLFPEWVPAVPVEPEEITKTFWNIRWARDTMLELRTPTTLRLRFYGGLANQGVTLGLIGLVIGLLRRPKREVLAQISD